MMMMMMMMMMTMTTTMVCPTVGLDGDHGPAAPGELVQRHVGRGGQLRHHGQVLRLPQGGWRNNLPNQ
jgi:hypothetical protein